MLEGSLVVIILTAITHMFLEGINCSFSLMLLLPLFLGIGAVFLLLFHVDIDESEKKLLWYVMTAILAIMLYKLLWLGVKTIANCILLSANSYYSTSFKTFKQELEGNYSVVFMAFAAAALIPALIFSENKKTEFFTLLELCVFSVCAALLVGNAPNTFDTMAMVLCLSIYYILYVKGAYGRIKMYDRGIIITSVAVVVLVLVLAASLGKGIFLPDHEGALSFQRNLENEMGLFSDGGYTDGSLSNKKPDKKHKEMLEILTSRPPYGYMYLRGFVGQEYQGNNWYEIKDKDFYKAMKKVGLDEGELSRMFNSQAHNQLFVFQPDAQMNVTIQYTNVSDKYSYAPYYTDYSDTEDSMKENGDGSFLRKRRSGQFRSMSPTSLFSFGADKDNANEAGVPAFVSYKGNEKEIRQWKRLKDDYKEYRSEKYLDIDEPLKEELLEFMGGRPFEDGEQLLERVFNKSYREINEYDIVNFVKDCLHESCTYSLELNSLGIGEDFVEHFLFKEKEGYCCHFATAATLMFRALGVPARYATGYIVRDDEFKHSYKGMYNGQYKASVTDDAAHAWTEIYYEDFGWIPIEVTPGYNYSEPVEQALYAYQDAEDALAQNDEESIEEQENEDIKDQQSTTMSLPQDNTELNKKDTGSGKAKTTENALAALNALIKVLAAVFIAALIFILLQLYKRYLDIKRHQANAKAAIEAVKKQLIRRMRIYERKGAEENEKEYLIRGAIAVLEKRKRSVLSESEKTELYDMAEQFYRVLEKSAYSNELISEEDARLANKLYDRIFK